MINLEKLFPNHMAQLTAEHHCVWTLLSKTYAAPTKLAPPSGETYFSDYVLLGATELLWECKSCGKTRRDTLRGSDSDTLEELLDKVDQLGAQHIERGAQSYVIGQVTPPVESLPVR